MEEIQKQKIIERAADLIGSQRKKIRRCAEILSLQKNSINAVDAEKSLAYSELVQAALQDFAQTKKAFDALLSEFRSVVLEDGGIALALRDLQSDIAAADALAFENKSLAKNAAENLAEMLGKEERAGSYENMFRKFQQQYSIGRIIESTF